LMSAVSGASEHLLNEVRKCIIRALKLTTSTSRSLCGKCSAR
jgi:hypothetical protein